MTKTTLVSLANIFFGFTLQVLFLYFITPSSLLDTYIAQISIPFFLTGLTLVSFREDFFSNMQNDRDEVIINQTIVSFIIFSSILCTGLMYLQGWQLRTCILGSFYYITSCSIGILSASIKRYLSNFIALLPISLIYAFTITIFLIFLSKAITLSILMVTTIASFVSLCIFATYFFLKTSFNIKFVITKYGYKIKFINILHNSLFVLYALIEGWLVSFLNTSDLTHLSFVHRIYVALNGIGVLLIFYNLDSIKTFSISSFKSKKLIFVLLGCVFVYLLHFLFFQYQILDTTLSIINLSDDKILLISIYFYLINMICGYNEYSLLFLITQ